MNNNIEKHHLIFYIITIIVYFLIEQFLINSLEIKPFLIGFVLKIFILTFVTIPLFFILYLEGVRNFIGNNYKTKNPISIDRDLLLTSSAIITTFLVDDLFILLDSITENSFLLTIVLIPILYLGIYKINKIVLIEMLSS